MIMMIIKGGIKRRSWGCGVWVEDGKKRDVTELGLGVGGESDVVRKRPRDRERVWGGVNGNLLLFLFYFIKWGRRD